MFYEKDKNDLLNFKINSYYKVIISLVFVYFILYLFNVLKLDKGIRLIELYYCLISVVVLVILNTTRRVNNKEIVSLLIVTFSFIGIYEFSLILIDDFYVQTASVWIYLKIKDIYMVLLMALSYCFLGMTIDRRKSFSVIFGITLFFINLVNIYLLDEIIFNSMIVIISFVTIVVNMVGGKIYKDEFLIRNGIVSTTLLFHYGIYVLSILNIIDVFIDYGKGPRIFILRLILFIIFITGAITIIDKCINRPYENIFEDLIIKNKKMNEINLKVIKQNRELEYAHMRIMKNDNLLQSFFNNIPIPLIILNKNTNRIAFANPSFAELINVHKIKQIINRKIDSLIIIQNDNLYDENNNIVRGSIKTREGTKYVEIETLDDKKKSDESIVLITDITEEVKINRIKEEIKNKEFDEKLKRDFLSNISHDLKTPVNVIYSAAQLIDVYCKDGNFVGIEKYSEIMRQNCVSLIEFTNDLIEKSKFEGKNSSVNLKVENIVVVVEEVVMSLIEYAKSKDILLIFDTDEEELYAEVEVNYMQRIIMNIISNSIKFCDKNGRIDISIKDLNEYIKIMFVDNGKGMDEEILKNVFERYTVGRNNMNISEKGTGIGMSVVKKLVESQNGFIKVNSKIDKGTIIEILFKKVKYNEEFKN